MEPVRDKVNPERHGQLLDIFGEKRVSAAPADRFAYARDQWPRLHLELRGGKAFAGPEFIVWPETVEEIGRLLRLANERRFPVVPVGGGCGTCGGAVPPEGAVVLDMKRMNRVLDISDVNRIAVVETGIIGQHLEVRLNEKGYTLGHFPGSMYCSTLGGFLACRSAGQLVSRYGKIEDMVVSLLAVLPDGSVFRTKTVPRSATGPNLNQVLLGSEGTLAVLAQAKLRIHRLPERILMRGFLFPSEKAGITAMRRILHAGVRPSVLRLYDRPHTELTVREPKGAVESGCLMIVGTEGNLRLAEVEMEIAAEICSATGGKDLGADPADRWWRHRYAAHYRQSTVLSRSGGVLDNVTIAASWSNVLPVYEAVRKALRSGVDCRTRFAHAYPDGCGLIFTVMGQAGRLPDLKLYDRIWNDAMTACLKAGGVISHHRGIGLLKAKWMEAQLGPAMAIYRGLKRALDPHNILNPGKMGL